MNIKVAHVDDIVRKLRKHRPRTEAEIIELCDAALLPIGGGQFRVVYRILGSPYVIKVPRHGAGHARAVRHAAEEADAIRRILRSERRFKAIRSCIPEMLYFSPDTGVIVMRHYRKVPPRFARKANALIEEVVRATGVDQPDLSPHQNLGMDAGGTLKIIDLGYCLGVAP